MVECWPFFADCYIFLFWSLNFKFFNLFWRLGLKAQPGFQSSMLIMDLMLEHFPKRWQLLPWVSLHSCHLVFHNLFVFHVSFVSLTSFITMIIWLFKKLLLSKIVYSFIWHSEDKIGTKVISLTWNTQWLNKFLEEKWLFGFF